MNHNNGLILTTKKRAQAARGIRGKLAKWSDATASPIQVEVNMVCVSSMQNTAAAYPSSSAWAVEWYKLKSVCSFT